MVHERKRVSVIGLGRLGVPIAACLAAGGFEVVGVDTDTHKVEAINAGSPPVYETGLAEKLQQAGARLIATTDIVAAVRDSRITFIIVPTPSEPDGGFSLRYVLQACRRIGLGIKDKPERHLVVLTSTVMPGATQGPVRQALEDASGKICGDGFGLCYSPEFVALGSVIRDFLNPDFLLIGESDPLAGDRLAEVYHEVCLNAPPVARLDFVNAELTKISVNAFITTRITFANMLAGVCGRIEGANVDAVTDTMGLDHRIGRTYLKGAVGYGGPCFPRDNAALAGLADRVHANANLARSVDVINRQQVSQLVGLVRRTLGRQRVVGVLGLAYKPNTDVVVQSQGLLLAQALVERGLKVVAHDPAATANAREVLAGRVECLTDLRTCVEASDVLVITTPWEPYRLLDAQVLARPGTPRAVIDCWRLLAGRDLGRGVRYIPLGVGLGRASPRNHPRNVRVNPLQVV